MCISFEKIILKCENKCKLTVHHVFTWTYIDDFTKSTSGKNEKQTSAQ